MRATGIFLCLFFLAVTGFAQRINTDPVCGTDTIEVNHRDLKYGGAIRYRALRCYRPSKLGLRVELGAAGFRYQGGTKTWLGDHGSAMLGLGLAFQNWTAIVRMKVWTIQPGRTLLVGNDTLTGAADLNPVKLDYLLGYSFNLPHHFSLEPYLGYSRNRFFVINEEALNKDLDLRTAKGIVAGLTANKYFPTKQYNFIALFLSAGYSSARFSSVHPSLGRGYWEAAAGIAFKGFHRIEYFRRLPATP